MIPPPPPPHTHNYSIKELIKSDLSKHFYYYNKKTILNKLKLLFIGGVQATIIFRFGQWIRKKPVIIHRLLYLPYYLFQRKVMIKWGIEIYPTTEIGPGLYIGHFGGIHINGKVKIGCNFNISQDVTIGVSGQGEKRGVPIIGDNVYIAPGAKIFGKIHIGNNVKIGANAVVYKDIPDNSVVVSGHGFTIL
jgi:serine O-acetyltransferase